MSDHEEFKPFPDAQHLLRHTFTWRFENQEDAAALNRVAELLQDWTFESGQYGPDNELSLLHSQIRAAAEDLLLVGSYIREHIANERIGHSLPLDEFRLSEMGDSWALRAERLGRAMLGALEVV